MQPKTPKFLEDVRAAATFILQATADKNLQDYQADQTLRFAVERNFEIIGEAMNRLVRLDPDTANRIDGYEHIIAFRNILIHGYDLIDDAHVWEIITDHLPTLHQQIQAILKEDAGGL